MTKHFITSIAPKHHFPLRQLECVQSWQKHGKVISMNHPSEIEQMNALYPDVEFVPTYRTQIAMLGKHYVCVNALIDLIRERQYECGIIINSDIEVSDWDDKLTSKLNTGMVYLHRWDFDLDDKSDAKFYSMGIDCFIISHKWAERIPQTIYTLGQTYFDLFLPWAYNQAGVQIYSDRMKPYLHHRNHKAQYSNEDWQRFGYFTGMMIKKPTWNPADVSRFFYQYLKQQTQSI